MKIITIGGGPGGTAAALRARQLGAETILIESSHLGGVCMNHGCIPMRVLGSTAEAAAVIEQAEKLGLNPVEPELNPQKLETRLSQTIQYMRMGTEGLLASNGVRVIKGKARLTAAGHVQIDDRKLEADAVILATGGTWLKPDFPGGDLEGVGSPTPDFGLPNLPPRVLIVGDAVWAVEMAGFYNRFGSKTALAVPGDFLPLIDRQTGSRLRLLLKKQGLEVLRQAKLSTITRTKNGLEVDLLVKGRKQKLVVDRVVTTDRGPGLEGLGLTESGIETANGAVTVNDRFQTTRPNVFAIGDLIGEPFFSHKASAQGLCAAENALGVGRPFVGHAIPVVLYTQPELASVGLTEKAAKASYGEIVVGEVPYGVNARAMAEIQTGGVVRAIFDGRYKQLLGVHILGPQSGELITQAALAIQLEATARELADVIAPHPTYAEALVDAARMAMGEALYAPNPA